MTEEPGSLLTHPRVPARRSTPGDGGVGGVVQGKKFPTPTPTISTLIRTTLSCYGLHPAELDDGEQSVWLAAWESWSACRHQDRPEAYLVGVARRVAANRRRTAAIRGRVCPTTSIEMTGDPVAEGPTPEDAASSREALSMLLRLARSQDQAKAMRLTAQGATRRETAAAIGCSLGRAQALVSSSRIVAFHPVAEDD